MEVHATKEAPLAARENLSEDEMPEHLIEMGISAEDSYQESVQEWNYKYILTSDPHKII